MLEDVDVPDSSLIVLLLLLTTLFDKSSDDDNVTAVDDEDCGGGDTAGKSPSFAIGVRRFVLLRGADPRLDLARVVVDVGAEEEEEEEEEEDETAEEGDEDRGIGESASIEASGRREDERIAVCS